jgi:hypothetical protein
MNYLRQSHLLGLGFVYVAVKCLFSTNSRKQGFEIEKQMLSKNLFLTLVMKLTFNKSVDATEPCYRQGELMILLFSRGIIYA